jgi:beta-galactosidase
MLRLSNCCPLAAALLIAATPLFAEIVDHWGSRPASPTVVHSVTVSPLQQVISLRGMWDFVTDPGLRGRHRMGKGPGWNEPGWSGVRKIQVPGCWAAQGVGEPGMSCEWPLPFDCIPRPLNHVYMGTARYRRGVVIPKDWYGKRIWLKVGGVRTEAWFWVNKKRVAHLNTYCGSYKYDVTDLVSPGKVAEIVATVRNDTPSRKGCMAAFHRWGGFYRDIELEATPATWLDDVWVRGDFDNRAALVNVSVRHVGDKAPGKLALNIVIKTLDGKPAETFSRALAPDENGNADVVCVVPLKEFRPWTPERPDLYVADVTLISDDGPIHGWSERFGVRKLEVRGERFYLNGSPYYLRGFGDDYIYPLTLISPPDRAVHVEHLKMARRAGFNYVRHHTHCEIPEFFEAADEVGILIQPELPYYHDITTEGFEFDPMRDIQELYRHYRRYVSFASYSTGNEGHLGSPLDKALYQWAKQTDPDRIFQHQDGGCNTRENSDYITPNGYGLASSIVPWKPGTFDGLSCPFVAHEYLNLGIKMDPRLAPRFTGAIPSPRRLEDYEASLRAAGLNRAWGDACLNAAHALQAYYQKQGLEQARRDPSCDGTSYWTIVDVMVPQKDTYTGQGYLNAFWEVKPGALTPEQFRRFNGPTVILATAKPDSMIAVSGETCKIILWISHFDAKRLMEKRVTWTLKTAADALVSGSLPPCDIAPGDVKQVGTCEFVVPELDEPVKATFEVTLSGTDLSNAWDFWFFPKRAGRRGDGIAATEDLLPTLSKRYPGIAKAGATEADAAGLVIGSRDHPVLLESVRRGKRGLMIGPADGKPNVTLGWWWLGDQVGTAFADHPVFGDFPHDGRLSPLWFRLIKRGLPLPIDPKHGQLDYFAVGEGRQQYFAYICQKTDKDGHRLLITRGVDLLADTPEGAYLLDAMIRYVQSPAFVRRVPARP